MPSDRICDYCFRRASAHGLFDHPPMFIEDIVAEAVERARTDPRVTSFGERLRRLNAMPVARLGRRSGERLA